MPDPDPCTVQPLPLHNVDYILKNVLGMAKKMSSSVIRVEERIEKAEVCMKEVKSEQIIIREAQRNIERTLETLVNVLRDQAAQPDRSVPLASGSGSGSQVVHHNGIRQSPEHSDRRVDTETGQHSIAGPSRKRRFEVEVPPISTSASTMVTSSDRTRKRRKQPPPIQTISEAVCIVKKEDPDEAERDTNKTEKRDELESDADQQMKGDIEERLVISPSTRKSTGKPAPAQTGLIFKHNDRCTGCIVKGRSECVVLKAPYLMLEGYVDQVLSRMARTSRPKSSSCFTCREDHSTYCHFPVTREKLGPGFTVAHRVGPFPVPESPQKSKGKTNKVKKARSLSPEFPFVPNTRT